MLHAPLCPGMPHDALACSTIPQASWSGSGSGFKEGVREKLGQTKDRLVKDAVSG